MRKNAPKTTRINRIVSIVCILCLTLAVNAWGAATSDNNIGFSEQVAIFDAEFTAATKALNIQPVNVEAIAARAPVNSDGIDAQIAQMNTTDFDKEKALKVAQIFSTERQTAESQTDADLSALQALEGTILQLVDDASVLQQRLNNHVSKAELSSVEQATLAQRISDARALQQNYLQLQSVSVANKDKLAQLGDAMTSWIGALAGELSDDRAQKAQSETQKARLEKQKCAFENEAETLKTQLDKTIVLLSNDAIVALQERIDHAKTQAWLADTDMKLANIMINRVPANVINESASAAELTKQLQTSKSHLAELKQLKNQLAERADALKQHDALMGKNQQLADAIASTQKVIAYQLIKQEDLPKRISDLLLSKSQSALLVRKSWFTRETVARAREKWGEALLQMGYQLEISAQTLWMAIQQRPLWAAAASGLSVLLLVIGLKFAERLTNTKLQLSAYERWVVTRLQNMLATISVLRYWIMAAVFLLILVYAMDVSSPSEGIIRLVAWGFIVLLSGTLLFKREATDKSAPKFLLFQVYGWFLVLAVTAILYGLAMLSLVDSAVMTLSEKALMLALIGASMTLFRLLRNRTRRARVDGAKLLYSSYRKTLTGLPLIGAVIGMASLVGYEKLAWLTLKYLGILAVFWIGVIVGLAIINHLRRFAKLYSARRFEYGAFIAQDIVSPLSAMAKLVWLYLAGRWLFAALGWDTNSYVVTQIVALADYPLLQLGETALTLKMLVFAVIALYVVFRMARWLKRFAYHWLFARVSDLGVRNSLAIFGQYLFSLCGLLVALKVLGIDLTSFAVFAGALGVGVGLGLQDIAKSFISGIILLIERPLRTGDWVTLDGNEGYVRSIGLRAITLETFDKQEVIIPNGNAINNSFTNFTHSSDINRTILYVGASYNAPPRVVLTLLDKAVNSVEGVLKAPESKMILWDYADSSITYRIHYFIDVNQSHTWDMKTAVMSAIWDIFEENNIEIPYPQRDLHLKTPLTDK